jgi:two-component system cell cycle sensor histidine kinase/response regulator CckA
VTVESQIQEGTIMRVYFPRNHTPGKTHSPRQDRTENQEGYGTLLLVEDEETVREYATTVLRDAGYTVIQAPNGVEGFALFQKDSDTIDGLVTDIVMPAMGGLELSQAIQRLRPEIPVLFMSGYPDRGNAQMAGLTANAAFLQKPFTALRLLQKVSQLFGDHKGK